MRTKRIHLPFRRDPLARIGLVLLIALLAVCLLSLVLPGLDGTSTVGARFEPPSWTFPLGTDALGRDLLPRLIEATRTTVFISVVAVTLSTLLATAIGIAAGLMGGPVEVLSMRIADGLFAFPAMLLSILVATIVGAGEVAAIASIFIITLPLMMRVFRGATRDVVHRDFVTASAVGGAGGLRIAVRHVLPNIGGAVAVQATYAASVAMLIEGGLSFLGFGVVPPAASLGSLVQEGSAYLTVYPWLALVPGAVLAAAILSVNLVGDGLRDALDPRDERSMS